MGTRKGVFYKSASNSDFVNISSDLPLNTYSEKIIPYYKEQKLRNATNRSVWERPFSVLSNRVIANPSAQSKEYYCTNDTVYFRDHSVVSDDNVMWSWSSEPSATKMDSSSSEFRIDKMW